MTDYSGAPHTVYPHRYHLVWITKYRYRVLQGQLRLCIREIIGQVAEEMGVKIVNGVLSSDHIHIFASIPPHIAVSELVKKARAALLDGYNKNFLRLVRNTGIGVFGAEGDRKSVV